MTPPEEAYLKWLTEENHKTLLEIKDMFEKFTEDKKRHWKDEAARRRERGY